MVQVNGVVTQAPAADAALDLTETLRPEGMTELARRGIYIKATRVEPSSSATPSSPGM
jgi:hypothetical protein